MPSSLLGPATAREATLYSLWPIHINKISMSGEGQAALDSPQMGKELAQLGVQVFEDYEKNVLPRELELDKPFSEEFAQSDHSRVNLAFLRFQKRAFGDENSDVFGAQELTPSAMPDGDLVAAGLSSEILAGQIVQSPRLKEISYTLPQLYENATFKRFRSRVNELAKMYLKRSGFPAERIPKKFKIFAWVEIFRKGDSLRPFARTDGGLLMGRYWPRKKRQSQKFNFEDPRGINPPFGKTHSHEVTEGDVTMFPTWASHFITPNMKKGANVCYAFVVYLPEGNVLDFEDDATGSFVKHDRMRV